MVHLTATVELDPTEVATLAMSQAPIDPDSDQAREMNAMFQLNPEGAIGALLRGWFLTYLHDNVKVHYNVTELDAGATRASEARGDAS